VQYDPKSPQFGAGPRDDAPGLYVHWATDTSGMAKGDRYEALSHDIELKLLAIEGNGWEMLVRFKSFSFYCEKNQNDRAGKYHSWRTISQ
jgi:hypothetical protein